MNRWLLARRKAYEIRQEVEQNHPGEDLFGGQIIVAVLAHAEIECIQVDPESPLLGNKNEGFDLARYYPTQRMIVVRSNVSIQEQYFFTAHELGHHFLHTRSTPYGDKEIEHDQLMLTLSYAEGRIDTYHPKQAQESEATAFALELLAPTSCIEKEFDDGKRATDLAAKFQLPYGYLLVQMSNVLLGPKQEWASASFKAHAQPIRWQDLDTSQQKACCISGRPALIGAGPGTGKTRTLTGRIDWLISELGVKPEKILVMTFSNRATEELRTRIFSTVQDEAHLVTISTFHGFGLEFLRRHLQHLNYGDDLKVVDPVLAELFLEANLNEVDLNHFADPVNPARYLGEIIEEIGRAKEELVDEIEYRRLVEQQAEAAHDEAEREVAEELLEVAEVYETYQRLLGERGFVDYGDLVMLPVKLLENHPALLDQLREQYEYILVDEYQDINFANGKLIELLAGEDAQELWAVGDLRQSIYRFRGASPSYFKAFQEKYPAAIIRKLGRNYRALPLLTRFVNRLGSNLHLPLEPLKLDSVAETEGTDAGELVIATAENKGAEHVGITTYISDLVSSGAKLSDIAVLCRTNPQAREVASSLSRADIPNMHLGDFFFQRETKDIFSVIDLIAYPQRIAWVRVLQFLPEAPLAEEIAKSWHKSRVSDGEFLKDFLVGLEELLDVEQHKRFRLLLEVVEKYLNKPKQNPWMITAEFLFEYGHYLRTIRAGDEFTRVKALFVLKNVMTFMTTYGGRSAITEEENLSRLLIQIIRKIVKRDGKDFDLSGGEDQAEAVRVLTIHKSKGMEFPIVILPNLAYRRFPPQFPRSQVPQLAGLVRFPEPNADTLEEESVLFVGASRAKKHLLMSRAQSYETRNGKLVPRKASILWELINPALADPEISFSELEWSAPQESLEEPKDIEILNSEQEVVQESEIYDYRALRVYDTCRRQYYYRYQLGLAVPNQIDTYLQFHRTIYNLIEWLLESVESGRAATQKEISARTGQAFEENIPADDPHHEWYKRELDRQVQHLLNDLMPLLQDKANLRLRLPAKINVGQGEVEFKVDLIIGERTLRQYRTGRVSSRHEKDPRMALYRKFGTESLNPPVTIEILYLRSGERREMSSKHDERTLLKLEENIVGIKSGNFFPNPNWVQTCAGCSYLFVCHWRESL